MTFEQWNFPETCISVLLVGLKLYFFVSFIFNGFSRNDVIIFFGHRGGVGGVSFLGACKFCSVFEDVVAAWFQNLFFFYKKQLFKFYNSELYYNLSFKIYFWSKSHFLKRKNHYIIITKLVEKCRRVKQRLCGLITVQTLLAIPCVQLLTLVFPHIL